MRRVNATIGWLIFALLLSGCKGMFGPQGLPPDPLFANRKPTEAKPNAGPPEPTAYSEPSPAVNPYLADQRSSTSAILRTDWPGAAPER
jgi:hypothetical protein